MEDEKQLSEAIDIAEFRKLRHAEPSTEAPAEPAGEKTTRTEEVQPEEAAKAPAAEESTTQESETGAKSVDDQIKELRKNGKHAAANKLMAEEAARPHREALAAVQRELEALKSRPSAEQKPGEAKPVPADTSDAEPQVTDEKYAGEDGYTKYVRDVARWEVRQETKALQQQNEQKAKREKVESLMAEARKAKPDFDTVASRVVINIAVLQEAVGKLANVGDVIYELGSNPAELSRIQALPPMDQWAELRIISRDLTAKTPAAEHAAAPEKLKPAVSRVAPAPRILGGGSAPESKSTAEAASLAEFRAARRKAS